MAVSEYFLVLLVKVKSLNMFLGNRDKDRLKLVKGSDKDEMGTNF